LSRKVFAIEPASGDWVPTVAAEPLEIRGNPKGNTWSGHCGELSEEQKRRRGKWKGRAVETRPLSKKFRE